MQGFVPMMTWWALTGSNRRPSRCKREATPENAAIVSSFGRTERDYMANKAKLADQSLTTRGIVSEWQFAERIIDLLSVCPHDCGWVTGPGRSGAVASVYASHLLGIPFVPFGSFADTSLGRVLLVDTAVMSGRTLRKAARKYEAREPFIWFGFNEPPVVRFWYEAPTPQRFRHERLKAGAA